MSRVPVSLVIAGMADRPVVGVLGLPDQQPPLVSLRVISCSPAARPDPST